MAAVFRLRRQVPNLINKEFNDKKQSQLKRTIEQEWSRVYLQYGKARSFILSQRDDRAPNRASNGSDVLSDPERKAG